MFQPLPFSIGLRYLRAKRRNGFISFISMASILGIIIGVIALITTIAVMSGFQQELRDRILGMVAHATVSGIDGPLENWPRAIELAGQDPRVLGAAPYIETESLLQGRQRRGAIIRGVLPELEPRVSEIAGKMKQGRLEDLRAGEFNIILGKELALLLGVGPGDAVNVFVSEATVTPVPHEPHQLVRQTVADLPAQQSGDMEPHERHVLEVLHVDVPDRLEEPRQRALGDLDVHQARMVRMGRELVRAWHGVPYAALANATGGRHSCLRRNPW